MNNIQTNTALFVNILSMSRTSEVQKWDHEAFQRAFRWAHYFEQVHKKTKSKQNVAEKISHHLSEACSNVGSRLGLSPLLYSDLPNSTNILRTRLARSNVGGGKSCVPNGPEDEAEPECHSAALAGAARAGDQAREARLHRERRQHRGGLR